MPRRIDWLLMETNTCIQLNNPTKTLPKIGDDSINVDIIGMVKAHLQSSTNKTIILLRRGIAVNQRFGSLKTSSTHLKLDVCLP